MDGGKSRTHDTRIMIPLLYQLSYAAKVSLLTGALTLLIASAMPAIILSTPVCTPANLIPQKNVNSVW